ncbi:hypothetical protein KXD93_17690 [Mucilaginibacter sp. BJC16-A38]|uniref:imm11 family protein n=1 Tax=Mucilaginibacter phenanthrenivorans TaxID=1234842 RepID=UPI00215867E8|nr:DUF1629 domain-containing protein [Mucilaginibacter phenanthrenivorans]MCR8559495.1 hypothetical protein [Mucilaginibacter phenanthrenivorans]
MSYYILEPACDTPETGPVYPQIQKLKPGYDDNKPDSIYSYLKKSINGFPDRVPDLDSFILHGHAKPTDLISNAITSGSGLFVSQKLKSILENHHLMTNRFYSAKVIYKKKVLDNYFWAHFIPDFTEYIDYPQSSFFIYKHYRLDDGNIAINSLDDYFKKRQQVQQDNPGINITIWAKRICFKQEFFDMQLDFFKISLFDGNYYISEALKNALMENKINGCHVQMTDRIIF